MEKSKETDGIGYILDQVIPDIMGYGYQPSKNLLKPDYDLKRLGIEQSPETERNMNNNVESKNSSLPGQYINGKPKFPSNLYWTNDLNTERNNLFSEQKIDFKKDWENFKEGLSDAGIESLYHLTGGAADRMWSDLNGAACKLKGTIGVGNESYADCFNQKRHQLDQRYQLAQSRSPKVVKATRETWEDFDNIMKVKKFFKDIADWGLSFAVSKLLIDTDLAQNGDKGITQEFLDRYSASEATDLEAFKRDMLMPNE